MRGIIVSTNLNETKCNIGPNNDIYSLYIEKTGVHAVRNYMNS